jgi:hypothetical protein
VTDTSRSVVLGGARRPLDIRRRHGCIRRPDWGRPSCRLRVSNHSQRAGRIEADVSLSDPKTTTGRLAFGRDSTDAYYSIGLGRGEFAYTAYQYIPGRAWVPLKLQGVSSNLTANRLYHVEVTFRGRRAWLRVDGATVFSVDLPTPLRGGQVGVFAFGPSPARFENFRAVGEMPQAFVVMQFGNPYDAL